MPKILITKEAHDAIRRYAKPFLNTSTSRKVQGGWVIDVDDDVFKELAKRAAKHDISLSDVICRQLRIHPTPTESN